MSAPVAWSTTRMESFTLPRLVEAEDLHLHLVADVHHVVVRLTRSFASSLMWTRPSWRRGS
jgi:hypothetical protein